MSMNMAVTLRAGRWSRRISASLPTSTLRSRVCSPGIRTRGIERASPPRRYAITFQASPRPRKSRLLGARNARLIHNDGTALHDPAHVCDGDLDVSERITLDGDDIGKVAWCDRTEAALFERPERFFSKGINWRPEKAG
jgi:hypothetical protein